MVVYKVEAMGKLDLQGAYKDRHDRLVVDSQDPMLIWVCGRKVTATTKLPVPQTIASSSRMASSCGTCKRPRLKRGGDNSLSRGRSEAEKAV